MRITTIYHVVPRREITDEETLSRCRKAYDSWNWLYQVGGVIPVHYWKYSRDSTSVKSPRALPFLKDTLQHGLSRCSNDFDVVFFTNDDVIVHPLAVREIKRHLQLYQSGSMRRVDVDTRDKNPPMPPLFTPPIAFMEMGWPHMGRDGFVFNAGWLKHHWNRIPDFILGAPYWDIFMAAFIRMLRGYTQTTIADMYQTYPDCELPDGLIIHEAHTSKWMQSKDWTKVPENNHNIDLFNEAQKKYFPKLKIVPTNIEEWPKATLLRYPKYINPNEDSVESIALQI